MTYGIHEEGMGTLGQNIDVGLGNSILVTTPKI